MLSLQLSCFMRKLIIYMILIMVFTYPELSNAFVDSLTVLSVEDTDDNTVINFEVMNRSISNEDIFFFGNGKTITHMKSGWEYIEPKRYYQPYLVDDDENKYIAEGNFVAGDITKYFYDPYEGYYGGDATFKYQLPPMIKAKGQFLFPKVQNGKHVKLIIPGISGWTSDMFVNNLLLPGAIEIAEEVNLEERLPPPDNKREVKRAIVLRPEAKSLSGIRKVDFKNRTYTLNTCNEWFKIGKKVKFKDGNYKNKYGEVGINKIFYGDFTGDGVDGAVVDLSCEPAHNNNAFGTELHMFKILKGKPVEIGSISDNKIQADYRKSFPDGFIWAFRIESIKESGVYISAAADGPHYCPQHTVSFHYKFGNNTFYLSEVPTIQPFK